MWAHHQLRSIHWIRCNLLDLMCSKPATIVNMNSFCSSYQSQPLYNHETSRIKTSEFFYANSFSRCHGCTAQFHAGLLAERRTGHFDSYRFSNFLIFHTRWEIFKFFFLLEFFCTCKTKTVSISGLYFWRCNQWITWLLLVVSFSWTWKEKEH